MRLLLRLASAEDAPVIWEMQKIAFRELLERYQDYDTSPANQSLDQLRLRCSQKDRYYYFIDVDGNPVGVLSVTSRMEVVSAFPRCSFSRSFRAGAMRRKRFDKLRKSMASGDGSWIRFYRRNVWSISMRKWDIGRQEKPRR